MIYLTGFLLGLTGSLHCLGMCGPIALALPVPAHLSRAVAIVLYNLGRVLTYSAIGSGFGFLGQVAVWAGWQQYLSIACGAFILLMVSISIVGTKGFFSSFLSAWTAKIKAQFTRLVKQHGLGPFVLLGMLNGALPCGLVYMALAGATATGAAWQGAVYMSFFGLGTVPLMFAIGYFHRLFALSWRSKIKSYATGLVVCTALLLIVRGMNLGIPYVSPKVSATTVSCCSVKHH